MRPFIHIAGSKAAKQIGMEAARAAFLALSVGYTIQHFVFDQQRKDIAAYYAKLKIEE